MIFFSFGAIFLFFHATCLKMTDHRQVLPNFSAHASLIAKLHRYEKQQPLTNIFTQPKYALVISERLGYNEIYLTLCLRRMKFLHCHIRDANSLSA